MMEFPKSAAFGRRIPKQKFYENLEVPASVKQLFVQQIKLIVWAYKLSPETMNIAPGEQVKEIQVFHLKLHGDTIDPQVLNLMDKQIPYHILFLLERPDGRTQLWVNYKEANQSGSNAFRLRQSYHTLWLPQEELTLELSALDMDALYEIYCSYMRLDSLIASKVDECFTLGTLLSFSYRHKLPFIYLTNGQRVPEDIESAESMNILRYLKSLDLDIDRFDHQVLS